MGKSSVTGAMRRASADSGISYPITAVEVIAVYREVMGAVTGPVAM